MCRRINASETWTSSNWFHFVLRVCWSLQFLQTWEIHLSCGSGRMHLCLERKTESRMVVMKVMFSLAEPLKGPQRGCSGMCLAKGVKGRVYNWAQLPVVKVKIALEILLIFQQNKVEQQVLYKSSRTPDPRVKVNHYIVLALQLASLPYRVVEESVVEGRGDTADLRFFLFFFFFPMLLALVWWTALFFLNC